MKETAYYGQMKTKLIKQVGGKIIKISDKSTLGLPDSCHIMDGVSTYIETKKDDIYGVNYIIPWNTVKKYLRQYEVCKDIRKHTLVLYVIYCPNLKMTAVLDVNMIAEKFYRNEEPLLEGSHFTQGHGIDLIAAEIYQHRRKVNEELSSRL
jgi:hypothetical protein